MHNKKTWLGIFLTAFLGIANAQSWENCFSGYKRGSPEMRACDARNADRSAEERRHQESLDAQKSQLKQLEDSIAKKRRLAELDADVAAILRQNEKLELKKRQQLEELMKPLPREPKSGAADEEKKAEVLKELASIILLAQNPEVQRASGLAKVGKCKESRNLLQKTAINMDKRTRALADYIQAAVAEECDKDGSLALTLYMRSVVGGSFVAAEKLTEMMSAGNAISKKPEQTQQPDTPSAPKQPDAPFDPKQFKQADLPFNTARNPRAADARKTLVYTPETKSLKCGSTDATLAFQIKKGTALVAEAIITVSRGEESITYYTDEQFVGMDCRENSAGKSFVVFQAYCRGVLCKDLDNFGIVDTDSVRLLLEPSNSNRLEAKAILGVVPGQVLQMHAMSRIGIALSTK